MYLQGALGLIDPAVLGRCSSQARRPRHSLSGGACPGGTADRHERPAWAAGPVAAVKSISSALQLALIRGKKERR